MVDWLIIAEKQSQADKIAEGLFDKGKGSGSYDKGGFGGNNLSSTLSCEIRITRFKGHIYEMKMPHEIDEKWSNKSKGFTNPFGMEIPGSYKSREELMKYYPIELEFKKSNWKLADKRHKAIESNLNKLYKEAKNVVVATDYDNEGEMIYLNWQNMNIKSPDWSKMYRAKLNVLTPNAVQAAFKQLIPYTKPGTDLESMRARGHARNICDYEYGMSFSHYGRELARDNNSVKGQFGRLKNALLGIVHQAEVAHDTFKDSSNFRVDLVLPNGESLQGDESLVFKTEAEAKAFIQKGTLPKNVELKFQEKKVSQKPDKLYSRNELIVALSKKHASVIGSGSWNTPLQDLYEKHTLLSYPRTDVQYISKDTYTDLSKLASKASVQALLNQRIQDVVKKSGIKSDAVINPSTPADKTYVDDSKLDGESHYALIPTETEPTNFSSLTQAEQVVYLEDLTHTMAIFYNPAIIMKRQYTAGELFKGSQSQTLEYGYKFVTGEVQPNKDKFPDAGSYDVTYKVSEVKAKRPPLFTKDSLLTKMKKVNWGTSATRDATVDDMVKKGSFKIVKGKLRVNPELSSTVQQLLDTQLIEFQMTSNWQMVLDKLQTEADADKFIENTRKHTREIHKRFNAILK